MYPSKNSHVYDKYFNNNSSTKIGNKYLHGLLFSEDIVPYQNRALVKTFT
jgi:hypothetical protein